MRGKIIAYTIMIILLISYTLYSIYTNTLAEKNISIKLQLGGSTREPGVAAVLNVTADYSIKVYRHGSLVAERVKIGDPISVNWYKLIANTFLIGHDSSSWGTVALTWYDTGLVSHTAAFDTDQGGQDPYPVIAIGDGTGTPSRLDYNLFNTVASAQPDAYSVTDTGTEYVIELVKTFTASSSFNLTEVGVILSVDANIATLGGPLGGKKIVNVLLCHDSVNPPISIDSGDTIVVEYTFHLPYSTSGPFTKWFYTLLIGYGFGLKSLGYAVSYIATSGTSYNYIDTGDDFWAASLSAWLNYVPDKITICIGNGTTTVANPYEQTSISALRAAEPSISIDTANAFTITYDHTFILTSPNNITQIAVYYHTDTGGTGNAPVDIMFLYFPLPNPVVVSSVPMGVRVTVTITIPYT